LNEVKGLKRKIFLDKAGQDCLGTDLLSMPTFNMDELGKASFSGQRPEDPENPA
jgi:hypothetical protein